MFQTDGATYAVSIIEYQLGGERASGDGSKGPGAGL